MSSSNPRWLVWCLQETHTCSAPDSWMRKLSNSRQSHWESPALYQPTGAHVSKVQCFRQIPVSKREKKKQKRQNDLHKCSSAVLPSVCGTAHQKRECVYREGKGVGTLHPVSCCASTVSLHAWTHFRNSSHIRLVSGSHAFKWGSEAAQALFEKVAECLSKIIISWGGFWERGVWWLFGFFPSLSVSYSKQEGAGLHNQTTLYTRDPSQRETECRWTSFVCVFLERRGSL